jgi:tol-pal system protein YbgF
VVATPPVQAVRADPALYDQALEQLKQGDYPKAAAGFQQFISQNPQGELAENAYYWLAETLYVNRQLPEAQAAFERMLSAYPSSAKAADALYKIGRIQLDTGNLDKAKQTLADVQTRHPNTTAARLAEQQLRRLKPGGS